MVGRVGGFLRHLGLARDRGAEEIPAFAGMAVRGMWRELGGASWEPSPTRATGLSLLLGPEPAGCEQLLHEFVEQVQLEQ